jgi:hypothetical protein
VVQVPQGSAALIKPHECVVDQRVYSANSNSATTSLRPKAIYMVASVCWPREGLRLERRRCALRRTHLKVLVPPLLKESQTHEFSTLQTG